MISGLSEAQRLLEPVTEDMIALLRELVRADSVNSPPDGNEAAAQAVLAEFLGEKGVPCEVYETEGLLQGGHPSARRDRAYRGRPNLAVRVQGSGRGPSLLWNGHIDTVPPGRAAWSAGSPWSGQLSGRRLYGLGSFDMKGGIAAQAASLAALAMSGIRLGGDLLFESVVDEEWGGGGGTLAARLRGDTADACVICEGTQLEILRATRGGFVVDLELRAGDTKNYFSRDAVLNPIGPLRRVLDWVESWEARRRRVKSNGAYAGLADPAPVQVLAVEANQIAPDVPLATPQEARVRVYFQFLPEEDVACVIGEIRESLAELEAREPQLREHPIGWRPLYEPPLLGHELVEDHPWTQCMAASAAKVLGRTAMISAAPYPCDAFLNQREFGIPTILFGPCGGGAHNVDEHVDVDSIVKTAETLVTAALAWCGG